MELIENYELKKHNTFHVGGNAAWAAFPKTLNELSEVLQWAKEQNVPFRVLGYGSNILVSDSGYNGVVIMLSELEDATSFQWLEKGKTYSAGAWMSLKKISNELLLEGCTDFIKLSGVPGTLGGAIKMNAGCFGKEVSEDITSVELIRGTGEQEHVAKEELGFAYRKSKVRVNEIIVRAEFATKEFGGEDEVARQKEEIKISRQNQPLGTKNAGSIFKNGKDYIAAKLIDEAGLKGMAFGGAEVSNIHANFIVNTGKATATNIYELICAVEEKVQEEFDIRMKREVELIGVFH